MSELGPASWLLFVEDPGAVNFFAPIVESLRCSKIPFRIYADGHATSLLKRRGIDPLDASDQVIDELQGNVLLVVVGTSENVDTFAFKLVEKAKQQGIPSVGIVDSGVNAAHRFSGRSTDPMLYAPDYLLVPDDWSAKQFSNLGFNHQRLSVVGYPVQDLINVRQPRDLVRARILPKEALDRLVLVFVSEISTGLNPQQYQKSATYTLHGRGASSLRTEIVVEELLDAIATSAAQGTKRPYMVLRRHPKETEQDLVYLAQEFDMVSSTGDPLELVYAADLVVGMSSNLLHEAHLLGTRTMAIVPRVEEATWLPSLRSGEIPCVADRPSLSDTLARLLTARYSQGIGSINDSSVPATVPFDPLTRLISISMYHK